MSQRRWSAKSFNPCHVYLVLIRHFHEVFRLDQGSEGIFIWYSSGVFDRSIYCYLIVIWAFTITLRWFYLIMRTPSIGDDVTSSFSSNVGDKNSPICIVRTAAAVMSPSRCNEGINNARIRWMQNILSEHDHAEKHDHQDHICMWSSLRLYMQVTITRDILCLHLTTSGALYMHVTTTIAVLYMHVTTARAVHSCGYGVLSATALVVLFWPILRWD